jgi:hypothetical protein
MPLNPTHPTNPSTTTITTPPVPLPILASPFSHPSQYAEFAKRIHPHMRSPHMQQLERDMEAAGLAPAVYWPKGVLEWVWSHPGHYEDVRRVARRCLRECALHGME